MGEIWRSGGDGDGDIIMWDGGSGYEKVGYKV